MQATLSIRGLTASGYLADFDSYTHEQILDAAARKLVDENDIEAVDDLYHALDDECDLAAKIALNEMNLSAYLD